MIWKLFNPLTALGTYMSLVGKLRKGHMSSGKEIYFYFL